ncbi:hypothetical protein [Nocardia sp. NPDC005366]|uniref:hypothetical protein n=1 Tax=Nocardia sp. NPDC005366 TaxID=3156878 RepID=UPI0033A00DEA
MPVVLIGLFIWGSIRQELDPPPAMRHAASTEVTGFETVSTSKENLDRLVVSKIFIGPVVDRPQDRKVSPGAAFREKGSPLGPAGAYWLVCRKPSVTKSL